MNDSNLLKRAVSSIKAGDIAAARKVLIEILKDDPNNKDAWLWLTKTTTEITKQRNYFGKVLEIDPNHEVAKKALGILNKKSADYQNDSLVNSRNSTNKRTHTIIVVGLIVIVCFAIGVLSSFMVRFVNNTSSNENTSSISSDTAPTEEPSPTPKPKLVDIIYEFEGRSDDFIQFEVPDDGRGYWAASHNGDSNFIVDHVSQDNYGSLWVNEIGVYNGRGTAEFLFAGLHTVEIKADGYWSIKIQVPNRSIYSDELDLNPAPNVEQNDDQIIISDLLPTATATLVPSQTPTPTPTPTPRPSGSTVNTDDGWAVRVVDIHYSERLEDGEFVYVAYGRYVHLVLEVTNNNLRNATFIPVGNFELITGAGMSYAPDVFADIINDDVYGIDWQNRPVELKPGEKGFEVVTFDIPVDSHGPYILQGGILSGLDAKVLLDIE